MNEWTFNPCDDSYLTIVSLFLIYLPVAFQWISQEPVRVRFHVQQKISGWTKQRGRAWDVCCVWRKVWQGWSWSTHRSYWQLLHAIGTGNDPRMAGLQWSHNIAKLHLFGTCDFFVTCSFLGTPTVDDTGNNKMQQTGRLAMTCHQIHIFTHCLFLKRGHR